MIRGLASMSVVAGDGGMKGGGGSATMGTVVWLLSLLSSTGCDIICRHDVCC